MTVLEVGPRNGIYTLATARRVGDRGKAVIVDIETRMIERVERLASMEGVGNIEARVVDVYDLPFENGTFDLVYMIAVIGEISEPEEAMREVHRVLSPWGTLVFRQLLLDPDYPRASTLVRRATSAGFRLRKRVGNIFCHKLIFATHQEFVEC